MLPHAMSRRRPAATLAIALIVVLGACAGGVRWISDYDETTDKSLTQIQQDTDDFIAKIEKSHKSDAASLSANSSFYESMDGELRRLEFRVGAIPKNTQSVQLVADIRKVILGSGKCDENGTSLHDLHCLKENAAKGPSVEALEIARRNVNTAISAALQLELAKKQGTSTK